MTGIPQLRMHAMNCREPLIKWVKKLLSSPAEELGSALDVEDLHSKADQVSLIGAFQSNEGELYDRFIQSMVGICNHSTEITSLYCLDHVTLCIFSKCSGPRQL